MNTQTSKQVYLDIRSPVDYRFGTMHSAINVSLRALQRELMQHDRSKKIVFICVSKTDAEAKMAEQYANVLGFTNVTLKPYKK